MTSQSVAHSLALAFSSLCAASFANAAPTEPTVGVIVSLSGPVAEYGQAAKNGAELLEESRTIDGTKLVWEDMHSDTKAAVSAFEKLSTTDKVRAVFIWGTTPTEGVAPLADGKSVPLVAMSYSPTVAKDRKYVIRSVSPSTALVKPLAEYVNDQKIKHLFIVNAQWSYTEEVSKALVAALDPSIKVSEMSFARDVQDFNTTISKIRADKAEMVAVLLSSGQISTFYKQMNAANLTLPTIGSDFFGSRKEITDSGPKIEGAVFPQLAVCPSFAEKYEKKYGTDTHIAYAINTYDMLKLISDAAKKTNSATDLLGNLKADQEYQGVCGPIRYREDSQIGGYFEYPVALYRVANGRRTPL